MPKNHSLLKRCISAFMAFCIVVSNISITYSDENNGKGDILAKVLDLNKSPYTNVSVMLYGRGSDRDQHISTSSSDNYGNVLFDAAEIDNAGEFISYYLIINQNNLKAQPYTIFDGGLTPWENYVFAEEAKTGAEAYINPEPSAQTEPEKEKQESEASEEKTDGQKNQEENNLVEVQAKGTIKNVYQAFIGAVLGIKTVYGSAVPEENAESTQEDTRESENIPPKQEAPENTGEDLANQAPSEEGVPSESNVPKDAEKENPDNPAPSAELFQTANENALCWKLEVQRLQWESIEDIPIAYDKSSFFSTEILYKYGGEDAPFFPDGDGQFEVPSGGIVNIRLEIVPALRAAIKNIGYTEINYEFIIPEKYRGYIKSLKAENENAGLSGEISVGTDIRRLDEGIVTLKLTANRTNSIRGQAVIPLSLAFTKGEIPNGTDFKIEGRLLNAKAVNSNGEYRNIVYDIVPETQSEALILPIEGKVKAYEEWKIENSNSLKPVEKAQPIKASFTLKTSIDTILKDSNLTITKNQVGRLYFNNFESNNKQSGYAVKGSFSGLKEGTKIKVTSIQIKGTDEELIGTDYVSVNDAGAKEAFTLSNGETFIISKFAGEAVDGKTAPYATEYIIETELEFNDYIELDHTKPEPEKAAIQLNGVLNYTLIGESPIEKEAASGFTLGGYFGTLVTGKITVKKNITGAGGLSNRAYDQYVMENFGFQPGLFQFYLLNKRPDRNTTEEELQSFLHNKDNWAIRQKDDGTGFESVAPSSSFNGEGKLIFTNIVEGNYYLYETLTDNGYSDYVWADNGIAVSIGPGNTDREVTVHNISNQRIGLNFTKKVFDEKLNDVTSNYYKDIEFTLTGPIGTKTFTPNQYSGLIEMRNLKAGTYTLEESKTPTGFIGIGKITFTITDKAYPNSIYNLFTATGVTVKMPEGSEALYDKNSSFLYNLKDTGILKIVKSYAPIAGYTPELGAEFLIQSSTGETRAVSMKDGGREGSNQVLYISLPAGIYTVKEINDTTNNKKYYKINNKESKAYTIESLALSGKDQIVTHLEENTTELQKITLKIGKYGVNGSFQGTLKINGIYGNEKNEIFNTQGKKVNDVYITVSDKGTELYLPKGIYMVENVTITGAKEYYVLPYQRFVVGENGEYQFDLPKLGMVEIKSYKKDTNGYFSSAKYTIYENGAKAADVTLNSTVNKSTGPMVAPGVKYRVKETAIDKGHNLNIDFSANTDNAVNAKYGENYAKTNRYGYPDAVDSNIADLVFDIPHSKQPILTAKVTDVYVQSISRAGEIEIRDSQGNIIKNSSGSDRHKITNKDTQIYLERPGEYTVTFFHTGDSGLSPELIDNRGTVDHKDKLSEESRTIKITVTENGPNKAEFYTIGAGSISFQKVIKDLYAQRSHNEVIRFMVHKTDKEGTIIGEAFAVSTDAAGAFKASNLDPRYHYVITEEGAEQYEPLQLEGKFNIKKKENYALTIGPAVNEILYRQIGITKGGYKTIQVQNDYYPQKGDSPIYDPNTEKPDIVTTDRMAYNGLFRIYKMTEGLRNKALNGTITKSDIDSAELADKVYTGTTEGENNRGLSKLLPFGDYLIVEDGPVNTGALYPYFEPNDKIPVYGDTVYNYYKDGSKYYFYTTASISKDIGKNKYAERIFYNPYNDAYGEGGNKLIFAQVKIKKYDLNSSSLIHNAVFDLYRAEVNNGKVFEFSSAFEKVQEGLTSGTAGNGMGISVVDLVAAVDKDGAVMPYHNLSNMIKRGNAYFAYYYLVETSAPKGYGLWTTPILVEIPLDTEGKGTIINSAKEVLISNSMEEFTLTIEKYGYTAVDLKNYVPMKDVELLVKGSNGDEYTYKTGYRYKDGKETGSSGSDGTLIVEGFRKLSPYYVVKEKTLPAKYENDYILREDETAITFNDTARTAKAAVFNFPKAVLKAVKTDISGAVIEESLTASFEIYKNEGTASAPSWVRIGSSTANLKNGNEYYMVLGSKVGFGEYKFIETTAPMGYLPVADGKPAELYFLYERTGTGVSLKYKLARDEEYKSYSENQSSLPKLKNDRKNTAQFYKKYIGPDGAELSGDKLTDALSLTAFALYISEEDANAGRNPIAVADYSKGIDPQGKVILTGLEKNTPYYVKELRGAQGYTINETIIKIPLFDEANQTVKLDDVINTAQKGTLILNKKDMTNAFIPKETLFRLTPAERNTDGSFTMKGASFSLKLTTGKEACDLDPGWYKVVEEKAPEGYDLAAQISPDNNSNIIIEKGGAYVYMEPAKTMEVTFHNGLLGSAEIFKYAKLNQTEWGLNGVRLALVKIEKDENNNWIVSEGADAYEAVTLSKNGQAGYASFTGLRHGSYWVIEKEGPSGYKIPTYLSEESFRAYLNEPDYASNIITIKDTSPSAPLLRLENAPKGGHVVINKYDISQKGTDGRPLENAALLKKENAKFSIYPYQKGAIDRSNPLVVLDLKYGTMYTVLEEGDYLIAETAFPKGYPSANHESALQSQKEGAEGKKVTIKAGETQVVDFFNEKLTVPDGTILKTIVSVDGTAVNDISAGTSSLLKNEVNAVVRLSGLFKTDAAGNPVKSNTPLRDVYVTDENIKYLSIGNADASVINITGSAYNQAYRIKSVNIGEAYDDDGPVYGRLYIKTFGSEQWALYGSPVYLDVPKEIRVDNEILKAIKVEYIKYKGDIPETTLSKGFTAGDIDLNLVFPKWKASQGLPEVKQIINSASAHFSYIDEENQASEIRRNSNLIRLNPEVQVIEKAKITFDKYTADGRSAYQAGEDIPFVLRMKNISQNIWRSPIVADYIPSSLYTPELGGYYTVQYNGTAYTGKIEFGKGETPDHKELLLWYMPELEIKPNEELTVMLGLKSREFIYVSETNTAFASSGYFYAPAGENEKGYSLDIAQGIGSPEITNAIDKILDHMGAKPTGGIKEDFSNNIYAASTVQYTVSFAEGTVGYKLVKGNMDREYSNKMGSSTFGGTVSYQIGAANTTEKTVNATRLFDLLPQYNNSTTYPGEVQLSKIIISSAFDKNKVKVYGAKTAGDLSDLEPFFLNKNGRFVNSLANAFLEQIAPADFANKEVLSGYRVIVVEYTGEIQKGSAFYAELEFDLPEPGFTGTEAEKAAQYQKAVTSKIQNTAQSVFIAGNEGTRSNQMSANSRVTGINAPLSGYVWHDKNGDGLFNYRGNDIRPTGDTEMPLKNVKVSLTQYINGQKTTFYQEAATDENGYFLFGNLPATVLINNAPQGNRYEYQITVDRSTGEAADYNSFTIKGEDYRINNNSKVTKEGNSDIVELGVQGRHFLNAGLLNQYKITIEKEFLQGEMLIEREGAVTLNLVNAENGKIVNTFSIHSNSRLSETVSAIPEGRYYIEEIFENSSEAFAGIKAEIDGMEVGSTADNIYRTEDFDITSDDVQIYIRVKNERIKDGALILLKHTDHFVSPKDKFRFIVEGPGEFAKGKGYELSEGNGFKAVIQNMPRGLYTVTEDLTVAPDYDLKDISTKGTSPLSKDILNKQMKIYINSGENNPVEVTFSNISKTRNVLFEKKLLDYFDFPDEKEKAFVFNLYKFNTVTGAYDLFKENLTLSNKRAEGPMTLPFGQYLIAEIAEKNQDYDVSKKYDISFYQDNHKLSDMHYDNYPGAVFSVNAQTDEAITIKTVNKEKNNGSLLIAKNLVVSNRDTLGSHKGTVYEIKIERLTDDLARAYTATKYVQMKDNLTQEILFAGLPSGTYRVMEIAYYYGENITWVDENNPPLGGRRAEFAGNSSLHYTAEISAETVIVPNEAESNGPAFAAINNTAKNYDVEIIKKLKGHKEPDNTLNGTQFMLFNKEGGISYEAAVSSGKALFADVAEGKYELREYITDSNRGYEPQGNWTLRHDTQEDRYYYVYNDIILIDKNTILEEEGEDRLLYRTEAVNKNLEATLIVEKTFDTAVSDEKLRQLIENKDIEFYLLPGKDNTNIQSEDALRLSYDGTLEGYIFRLENIDISAVKDYTLAEVSPAGFTVKGWALAEVFDKDKDGRIFNKLYTNITFSNREDAVLSDGIKGPSHLIIKNIEVQNIEEKGIIAVLKTFDKESISADKLSETADKIRFALVSEDGKTIIKGPQKLKDNPMDNLKNAIENEGLKAQYQENGLLKALFNKAEEKLGIAISGLPHGSYRLYEFTTDYFAPEGWAIEDNQELIKNAGLDLGVYNAYYRPVEIGVNAGAYEPNQIGSSLIHVIDLDNKIEKMDIEVIKRGTDGFWDTMKQLIGAEEKVTMRFALERYSEGGHFDLRFGNGGVIYGKKSVSLDNLITRDVTVEFQGLQTGSYRLTEFSSKAYGPNAYNQEKWQFRGTGSYDGSTEAYYIYSRDIEIAPQADDVLGSQSILITNGMQRASIIIEKTILAYDEGSQSGYAPITDLKDTITFSLYQYEDGKDYDDFKRLEGVSDVKTDADGKVVFTDIPHGKYVIKEVNRSSGYLTKWGKDYSNIIAIPEDAALEERENQEGEAYVSVEYRDKLENKIGFGRIEIEKILDLTPDMPNSQRTANIDDNITFKLTGPYDKETNGVLEGYGERTSAADNGRIVFENLPYGRYTLEEIWPENPPEDYLTLWTSKDLEGNDITIEPNSRKITVDIGEMKGPNEEITGLTEISYRVQNKLNLGTIEVRKAIASNSISAYKNETFEIMLYKVEAEKELLIERAYLGNNETHRFTNLKPGTYKVTEESNSGRWSRVLGSNDTLYPLGEGNPYNKGIVITNEYWFDPYIPPTTPTRPITPTPPTTPTKPAVPETAEPPTGIINIPTPEIPLGPVDIIVPPVVEDNALTEITKGETPLGPKLFKNNPRTGVYVDSSGSAMLLLIAGVLGLFFGTRRRK